MDGPCPFWVTVPGSQGPHLCPLRRLPEKLRKLSPRSYQVGWGPRKPAHILPAPGPSTGVSVQHRDPSPGVQACPLQQTPCSHRSPGVAGPPRTAVLRALRCPGRVSCRGRRREQSLAPPRVCFLHRKSRALRYLCSHLERNPGVHVGAGAPARDPTAPGAGSGTESEWGADPHCPWSWDPTEETAQDPGWAR